MSLDYPILPICQTAESFRNILSAMGPYRDSISLKKSPLLGLYTGSEAQLDLATVRYHALGAYAKSVYLVKSWQWAVRTSGMLMNFCDHLGEWVLQKERILESRRFCSFGQLSPIASTSTNLNLKIFSAIKLICWYIGLITSQKKYNTFPS